MADDDEAPTELEVLLEVFREVRAIRRFLYGATTVALLVLLFAVGGR